MRTPTIHRLSVLPPLPILRLTAFHSARNPLPAAGTPCGSRPSVLATASVRIHTAALVPRPVGRCAVVVRWLILRALLRGTAVMIVVVHLAATTSNHGRNTNQQAHQDDELLHRGLLVSEDGTSEAFHL